MRSTVWEATLGTSARFHCSLSPQSPLSQHSVLCLKSPLEHLLPKHMKSYVLPNSSTLTKMKEVLQGWVSPGKISFKYSSPVLRLNVCPGTAGSAAMCHGYRRTCRCASSCQTVIGRSCISVSSWTCNAARTSRSTWGCLPLNLVHAQESQGPGAQGMVT